MGVPALRQGRTYQPRDTGYRGGLRARIIRFRRGGYVEFWCGGQRFQWTKAEFRKRYVELPAILSPAII